MSQPTPAADLRRFIRDVPDFPKPGILFRDVTPLLLDPAAAVSCFAHGDQGGTYGGNPLMAAVGSAVLDVGAQPQFLAGVAERGAHLQGHLRRLSERHGLAGERGGGLLRALDLGRPIGAAVVEAARELQPEGLLLNSPRPHLLRFMPRLNVPFEEIDRMASQLDRLLAQMG